MSDLYIHVKLSIIMFFYCLSNWCKSIHGHMKILWYDVYMLRLALIFCINDFTLWSSKYGILIKVFNALTYHATIFSLFMMMRKLIWNDFFSTNIYIYNLSMYISIIMWFSFAPLLDIHIDLSLIKTSPLLLSGQR